jgi:hypothetical protein
MNDSYARTLPAWCNLIDELHSDVRLRLSGAPQRWTLTDEAATFHHAKRREWQRWALELGHATPAGGALAKGDIQALRLALILAVMENPRARDAQARISLDVITRAAQLVEFSVGCWSTITDASDAYALSWKDKAVERAVFELHAFLRGVDQGVTRRDVQRRAFAWANTTDKLTAVLDLYQEMYPGNVAGYKKKIGGGRVLDKRRFFDSIPRREQYQANNTGDTSDDD